MVCRCLPWRSELKIIMQRHLYKGYLPNPVLQRANIVWFQISSSDDQTLLLSFPPTGMGSSDGSLIFQRLQCLVSNFLLRWSDLASKLSLHFCGLKCQECWYRHFSVSAVRAWCQVTILGVWKHLETFKVLTPKKHTLDGSLILKPGQWWFS